MWLRGTSKWVCMNWIELERKEYGNRNQQQKLKQLWTRACSRNLQWYAAANFENCYYSHIRSSNYSPQFLSLPLTRLRVCQSLLLFFHLHRLTLLACSWARKKSCQGQKRWPGIYICCSSCGVGGGYGDVLLFSFFLLVLRLQLIAIEL